MRSKDFYKQKAWKLASKSVLLHYSIDGLIAKCCTCGSFLQINTSKAHCGHLIKVTDSWATALEFENLTPQCLACNRYHGGKPDVMERWLIEQHGVVPINRLYIKKHNFCKPDIMYFKYWEMHYQNMFDDLVKVKGNPWKAKKTSIRTF